MRVIFLCLALVSVATPATAQEQPPPKPPVFRTGVELLTVDVTVVDSDGRQVPDLTPADFEVEVDGDPRPLVSADYVSAVDESLLEARKPSRTPDADTSEQFFSTNASRPAQGRSILLLVDQGNIRVGSARAVMRSAIRFVDDLQPSDRVGVVAIPAPGALVDFTTEHEKVKEAMLAIVGQKSPYRGRFNISLTEALATVERSDAALRAQLIERECAFAMQSVAEAVRCELEIEQEAGEMIAQQRQETQASLRGIQAVLQSLAALDGPKSVVLISEGLVLEGLTSDVDNLAALAADVRASLDVMLLDVPQVDVTQSQRPTTPREDRELHVQGLESLAGVARGTLHRIPAGADAAFARINRALAGYYLLGLETRIADRDGRRHRLNVRVKRKGVRVNSRRGFLAAASPAATTPEEAVTRALRAPLPLTELPIRLATWTFKEPGSSNVRVLVAAEVDRLGGTSLDYTSAMVLVGPDGKGVGTAAARRTLDASSSEDRARFTAGMTVPPGRYLVRLALADAEGRIGSIERRVDAWQLDGTALALGDLMVGGAPSPGTQALTPQVEADVRDQLAAVLEVYAGDPPRLERVQGTLEVMPSGSATAVLTAPLQLGPGTGADARSLQTAIDLAALPPGAYLARATVREGDTVSGHLTRPFRVLPGSGAREGAAASSPALLTAMLGSLPATDPKELLQPAVLEAVLAAAESMRPAARPALASARGGKVGPAALEALAAGDQPVAAFLRGVELFGLGQHERAQQQLQIAMQGAPSFAPARLYLGAVLAASQRHREAAGLLQSVPAGLAGPVRVDRMAASNWLKSGEAANAASALEQGDRGASDPATARTLAIAYLATNRSSDAVPLLATYLDGNPRDVDALLAGLYAIYRTHTPALRSESLAADQARAAAWANAYAAAKGPQQALVALWLNYLTGAGAAK